MTREARMELDPDPLAPREAREFVTDKVREWGFDDHVDTVRLLTSELVTNGVLHARTGLDVRVSESDCDLTVEVHDHDPHPPIPRGHRMNLLADIERVLKIPDESNGDERQTLTAGPAGSIGAGRGLLLVEALADEWGVAKEHDGKSVWFRLHVA
jgi:anti-sigma regulatory factor (Ser/Thr protein kinase)